MDYKVGGCCYGRAIEWVLSPSSLFYLFEFLAVEEFHYLPDDVLSLVDSTRLVSLATWKNILF